MVTMIGNRLKLDSRDLGSIEDGVWFVARPKKKHFMHKVKGWGFNEYVCRHAHKFGFKRVAFRGVRLLADGGWKTVYAQFKMKDALPLMVSLLGTGFEGQLFLSYENMMRVAE